MQTITKCLVVFILSLSAHLINAQDSIPVIKSIEMLDKSKITIQEEEKGFLKDEVVAINKRLERNEITFEAAEILKKKAAKKHALNIENRIAIVDNKISLLNRNPDRSPVDENEMVFRIGGSKGGDTNFIYIGKQEDDKPKNRKYDRRTSSDFVLAFGLNNAIIEGEKIDDSPYKFGGSRFFEIGWAWKTRVFKNSNFMRFKYGYSLQINGLKPNDNQYFIQQGDQTVLQVFPENLNKSKLSMTNLVFPVHFEFGPSKKIERDTYFRYSTEKQFKFGIGGYGGFNIGTRQKLKYELDDKRKKDKQKGGLNTSDLVYGLSTYLAFGNAALYVKYDLSPIFKDQVVDQHNISVGLRFDID